MLKVLESGYGTEGGYLSRFVATLEPIRKAARDNMFPPSNNTDRIESCTVHP